MWIGCFVILILSIFLREYYLQYTNLLSLSNKKSAIVSTVISVISVSTVISVISVSTVISVHTSEKQEEIKTVSVLTRLPHSLVP